MAKKRTNLRSPDQREKAKDIKANFQKEIAALTKKLEKELKEVVEEDEQLAFDAVEVERKKEFDKLYELRKTFYAAIAKAKQDGDIPKSTNLKKIAALPAKAESIKNVPLFMKRRFGTAGIVRMTVDKQRKAIKKRKTHTADGKPITVAPPAKSYVNKQKAKAAAKKAPKKK